MHWVISKADWIVTQLDKIANQPKQHASSEQELQLPDQIELTALDTTLAIEYKPQPARRLELISHKPKN